MAANPWARMKPWTTRMMQLLYERGPQPRDVVVDQCALLVPPGRAMRRFEDGIHRKGIKREPSVEAKIESGSRWVVLESMRIQRLNDRIREYEQGGVKMVALTELGVEIFFTIPAIEAKYKEGRNAKE